MLDDGRVLVAGGVAAGGELASVEIYDPVADRWSVTAPMAAPRLGHTLTTLKDGRVLVAGGSVPGDASPGQAVNPSASAELYDPRKGAWAASPDMTSARFEHTATLLGDGRVLVVGGLGSGQTGPAPLSTTELYDPAAGAFVAASDLSDARTNHVAVVDGDGVLVASGTGGPNGDVSLRSAEVFDPRRGRWTLAAPMGQARTGATGTALADGRILVAGGEIVAGGSRRSLLSAEILSPGATTWRSAGTMTCPRSEQAAVLLGDGSVMVVAGDAAAPGEAPTAQGCVDRYRPDQGKAK